MLLIWRCCSCANFFIVICPQLPQTRCRHCPSLYRWPDITDRCCLYDRPSGSERAAIQMRNPSSSPVLADKAKAPCLIALWSSSARDRSLGGQDHRLGRKLYRGRLPVDGKRPEESGEGRTKSREWQEVCQTAPPSEGARHLPDALVTVHKDTVSGSLKRFEADRFWRTPAQAPANVPRTYDNDRSTASARRKSVRRLCISKNVVEPSLFSFRKVLRLFHLFRRI